MSIERFEQSKLGTVTFIRHLVGGHPPNSSAVPLKAGGNSQTTVCHLEISVNIIILATNRRKRELVPLPSSAVREVVQSQRAESSPPRLSEASFHLLGHTNPKDGTIVLTVVVQTRTLQRPGIITSASVVCFAFNSVSPYTVVAPCGVFPFMDSTQEYRRIETDISRSFQQTAVADLDGGVMYPGGLLDCHNHLATDIPHATIVDGMGPLRRASSNAPTHSSTSSQMPSPSSSTEQASVSRCNGQKTQTWAGGTSKAQSNCCCCSGIGTMPESRRRRTPPISKSAVKNGPLVVEFHTSP